jgi:hypothetical protein
MSFKDTVHFTDKIEAGLEKSVTPPLHPCADCGSETKEHHPVLDDDGKIVSKRRICSRPGCRKILEAS